MNANPFGRVSELVLSAERRAGKTVLRDVYCTAPFRVMSPFYKGERAGVVLMSASAGLMAGDVQSLRIEVGSGADLELTGQSFEKIHRMEAGHAERRVHIKVAENAAFFYRATPVVPFADSALRASTEFFLENESSRLVLSEVLYAGRCGMGECFRFRLYHALTRGYRRGELIYRDNARWEPSTLPPDGLGLFEGHTHLLSLLYCGAGARERLPAVQEMLGELEGCAGGASSPRKDMVAVRVLGTDAQALSNVELCVLDQLGLDARR